MEHVSNIQRERGRESCPETWLWPVRNFSSFAFTKPQLLDFGANRGKKKNKKKNRFDVSTFPSRFPRGSLETKRKTDYILLYCPSNGKYVCQNRDRNWGEKKPWWKFPQDFSQTRKEATNICNVVEMIEEREEEREERDDGIFEINYRPSWEGEMAR